MDACVERAKAQQACRTGQRQQAAQHQQDAGRDAGPQGDGGFDHGSITSPRSRKRAIAVDPTKPNSAISNAISKYSDAPDRMPKTSMVSMPLMYSVSSARTRSCAVGPRSRRMAANTMPSAKHTRAKDAAQYSAVFIVIQTSPSTGARSAPAPA
ncbi:hypothetical protein G6F22_019355 [Rhizopus arrhizus]|nr:hypothetical protein G6F22_019355 [Rhizopus arrhizus]